MVDEIVVDTDFPRKLQFLFRPKRYKIAYGGRASTKSWSFARALILMASQKRLRILCAREVQKSIKDSVHKLLGDQIEAMNLSHKFTVLDTEIRCENGSEFLFTGLSSHTVASIKSYESIDITWVEEAQAVSKKSWDILTPTIRKPGSEIWITFNPELDTDETYVRFVVHPPEDSIVCFINWQDNKWFSEESEKERQHCLVVSPDDYDTIWEGKCRSSVIGAIYAKEVQLAVQEGRIGRVPYNPLLKVHTVWDLGWNDSMFIILAQRIRSEIAIIETIQNSHKTLDWYVAELQNKRMNWGTDFLPHDGEHSDYKTGLSAKKILERFGRKVKIVPNIPVEEGIKIARMAFRQVAFDSVKAARLIECLKRYKRHIPKHGEPSNPVHDEYSHGADDFRYLSIVAEMMTNDADRVRHENFSTFNSAVSGFGG